MYHTVRVGWPETGWFFRLDADHAEPRLGPRLVPEVGGQGQALGLQTVRLPGRGKKDCARLTSVTQCCQYRKKIAKKGPKIAKNIQIQFFGVFWPFFGDFFSVLATLSR